MKSSFCSLLLSAFTQCYNDSTLQTELCQPLPILCRELHCLAEPEFQRSSYQSEIACVTAKLCFALLWYQIPTPQCAATKLSVKGIGEPQVFFILSVDTSAPFYRTQRTIYITLWPLNELMVTCYDPSLPQKFWNMKDSQSTMGVLNGANKNKGPIRMF